MTTTSATLRTLISRASNENSSLVSTAILSGPAGELHYGATYAHTVPEAERRALELDMLPEHTTLADKLLNEDEDAARVFVENLEKGIKTQSNIENKPMSENWSRFQEHSVKPFAIDGEKWTKTDTAIFILVANMFTNPNVPLEHIFRNRLSSAVYRYFNNMYAALDRHFVNNDMGNLYVETLKKLQQ